MKKYGITKTYKKSKRSKRSNVPWYNQKMTPLQMAQKALRAANYVRTLINVERKAFDKTITSTSITQTGVFSALHLIPQGTTGQTRDGNEVKMISLMERFTLARNSAGLVVQRVRYILFKDNQFLPGASTPSLADILENTTLNILSPLNIIDGNAGNRFQIIKDHVYSTDDNNKQQITVENVYKIQDHLHYVGTAGTDIVSPVYYALFISDVASNQPVVEAYYRTRFVDN